MVIKADQLLNRPSELHRRYSGRLAMQKAQQEKMVGGASVNIVLTKKSIKNVDIIKTNVVKIESILKGTLALDKKQLDDKKRDVSKKRKEKIETKLETKPNAESGKISMPAAPRMGILDFVKNFIGNVLLGHFAVRLVKHLPKIVPIVKFLGNAADFIIDVGGKLLNGLVSFIDWGYKAYDATRGFIKNIGGENFAKGFDKFLGAIDTALFLTTALAGSMAMEAMSGGGGGGPGGGRPGRGGRYGLTETRDARRGVSRVDTTGGMNYRNHRTTGTIQESGSKLADARIERLNRAGRLTFDGKSVTDMSYQQRKGYSDVIKKYADRFGRDAALKRFGQESVEGLGGKYARSGATNLARKGLVGLAGKGGAKAVLGAVRPLLKRLPIIGALIDFGLSVALGEDPGRAAFKAIGAGLLGSFGAAIGSVVPIAGNIVGGIIGGIAGDTLGAALYDIFFGGKKPQQKNQKIQKKEGGGITRGGKSQRGARRTISKGKYKRVLAPQKPSKTELKTEAFTKPENKILKESTEELDKTKYFGPILAISSKIMNKEEPTQRDYQNVGLGINMLISQGVQQQQLKGGLVAAFAGGGLVDPDVLSAAETGGDISNWVAKTFRGEVESNAQKTLRMIREKKEDKKPAGVPGPGQPGSPDMVNIQGGNVDFWTLVAVASREDGEPQAWADVAQSIYNRLASGAYSGKTIKDLILGQMQYEPTWKFPKQGTTGKPNSEWYAIKDAGSAGVAAGQSEEAMKKVAAAILDPTLQKNAKEFIQGRTDFRGYSVSGGVQRKSGDNYYGWYNNYKANKIGSVPNFGATASISAGPGGGTFVGGGTGAGYGSGGSKIAGDLGDYMKQTRIPTGSIHQHPRHLPMSRRGYKSYHNEGRAIDLGGYGPAHPSSGGRDEQAPILRALIEWNKKRGVTPVQVIHGSPAFRGFGKYESGPNDLHSHHVHVAYAKGGETLDGPHLAMVGEKGREIVIDNDSVESHPEVRQMLLAINQASNYQGVLNAIRQYAPYDAMAPQTIIVPTQGGDENEYDSGMSGGVALISIGGEDSYDAFDFLVMGG